MTTSRAILATPHPSPPTASGSQCRLFAFASSSLAFLQLSLDFPPLSQAFFLHSRATSNDIDKKASANMENANIR